jgi:hypothetical protein
MSVGEKQPPSQARMVGDADFLKSQRPKSGKEREYGMPVQRQQIMHEDLSSVEPSAYGPHRPAQTGKRQRLDHRLLAITQQIQNITAPEE